MPRLKHMRWSLLRRGSRVRGRAREKLNALLASRLATARAWNLKESFRYFCHYKSFLFSGRAPFSTTGVFGLCAAVGTDQECGPHAARPRGTIAELVPRQSRATVEGLNNKIRVVTRRSYGFRTYEAMEIALYHTLGRLPEPESTHRFR